MKLVEELLFVLDYLKGATVSKFTLGLKVQSTQLNRCTLSRTFYSKDHKIGYHKKVVSIRGFGYCYRVRVFISNKNKFGRCSILSVEKVRFFELGYFDAEIILAYPGLQSYIEFEER